MKLTLLILVAGALICAGSFPSVADRQEPTSESPAQETGMELGNFSVSLAVKDLAASQAFYEKLGLKQIAGDPSQNYVIMQNGTSTIGLFQGMFEENILTFNPGWDRSAQPLSEFQDVRDIQRVLKERGIEPIVKADESTDGPANMVLVDPDGNQILIDQHVDRPK